MAQGRDGGRDKLQHNILYEPLMLANISIDAGVGFLTMLGTRQTHQAPDTAMPWQSIKRERRSGWRWGTTTGKTRLWREELFSLYSIWARRRTAERTRSWPGTAR